MMLLEPALRAMLLGAMVWMLLRLLRVRDARAETMAWTAVLLAAMAMPFASPALAALLPGVTLAPPQAFPAAAAAPDWMARHAALLWSLHGAIILLLLARMATGYAITWRLYRAALPAAPTGAGLRLRHSARLHSPIVFGRCILLPADFAQWPAARRAAVLAHEACHVQRGDFFIQLAAGLYRALFWFSPFAWWLKARLGRLAESDSDSAALASMGDRASYAELLIEVSRLGPPLAGAAMAGGPGLAWRIERILDETIRERRISRSACAALVAWVTVSALAFAGLHAAPPAAAAPIAPARMAQAPGRTGPAPAIAAAATPTRVTPRPNRPAATPVKDGPEVSANPRALLDAPAAIFMPTALFVNPQ